MAATATATAPTLTLVDSRVECALCAFRSHSLLDHLVEAHDLTPAEYLGKFPDAGTISEALRSRVEEANKGKRRSAAPDIVNLTVRMCGITGRVDHGVRENQCLPLPEGYAWATKGKAKKAIRRAILALSRKRPVFIWGGPGVGKDAVIHAYSALTRTPSLLYTFTPGTDIKRWFYSRTIDHDGTGWEYGVLWKALTEGIEGSDGVTRPALLLFSDIDRGTPEQLEEFRLVLDTTSKRIVGPTGAIHRIFPGTQFAFTANSCGTGDETGRMSCQRMDASMLDRMGRFVEFTHLHWDDEGEILRSKFPTVTEVAPSVFAELGCAAATLRRAISGLGDTDLYAELTHRGLCEILSEIDDLIWLADGKAPKNLLKKGFRAWLDRLDSDNQLVAKRLIDAGIEGGSFGDDDDDDDDDE